MPVRILGLNGDSTVETEPNLNLLGHAQLDEITLGSRCGGHGKCGGDRVLVRVQSADRTRALSPITEAERTHLSTAELASGWRLACQCWPNDRSLEIEVRASGRES